MHYLVGNIVEGVITGIQPYGAFVSLDNDHPGLIHISEISSGYVKDVNKFVKLHERVRVKILDMDEEQNHFKLSLKAVKARNVRKARKHPSPRLPDMIIGFRSIADKMDDWLKEAGRKEEI